MHASALTTLSTTLALAFCMNASAVSLSKVEYRAGKTEISTQLKAAMAACDVFNGNAKDICRAEAKGRDKVALAELQTRYEPSTRHSYALATAKADAAYSVSKEKCDDLAGNAKDVCRKEAKSVHVAAVADAKLIEKTALNSAEANEKINKAAYKAAAEKCDALAGAAKTQCVSEAKAQFGQN